VDIPLGFGWHATLFGPLAILTAVALVVVLVKWWMTTPPA
jgi:hypothetical protein